MLQYVVPFIIALVVSYLLTPGVKKVAIKVGAVDRPNARKVHTHVIPRLGGLAIYIGFMAAVLFCVPLHHELIGMLLGCTAIVAIGIWTISAISRLGSSSSARLQRPVFPWPSVFRSNG